MDIDAVKFYLQVDWTNDRFIPKWQPECVCDKLQIKVGHVMKYNTTEGTLYDLVKAEVRGSFNLRADLVGAGTQVAIVDINFDCATVKTDYLDSFVVNLYSPETDALLREIVYGSEEQTTLENKISQLSDINFNYVINVP